MTSRAYGARSPRSHYGVIVIVTSFATELVTPTVKDVRPDTLPHLIKMTYYLTLRSLLSVLRTGKGVIPC